MTTRSAHKLQVAGLPVTEWPGSGQVVFALPGLGSSASSWSHLAQALPDSRVLSVDLRGRGDAKDLTGPTGMRAHARDVAAVLTELDLTDVVVIGHSMGAYLAPLVAQEAPDRVAKLVLVDGGIRPAFPFFMGPRLTRFAFNKQLKSMDREWPTIEALAAKGKVDKMLASEPHLRPVVLKMLEDEMSGGPGAWRPRTDIPRCVADAVDCFWGDDVTGALESLKVPADVLLATNKQWDGQKPFIGDAVVAPWTANQPLLQVRRLPGNHVTVVFRDEVRDACARP